MIYKYKRILNKEKYHLEIRFGYTDDWDEYINKFEITIDAKEVFNYKDLINKMFIIDIFNEIERLLKNAHDLKFCIMNIKNEIVRKNILKVFKYRISLGDVNLKFINYNKGV